MNSHGNMKLQLSKLYCNLFRIYSCAAIFLSSSSMFYRLCTYSRENEDSKRKCDNQLLELSTFVTFHSPIFGSNIKIIDIQNKNAQKNNFSAFHSGPFYFNHGKISVQQVHFLPNLLSNLRISEATDCGSIVLYLSHDAWNLFSLGSCCTSFFLALLFFFSSNVCYYY